MKSPPAGRYPLRVYQLRPPKGPIEVAIGLALAGMRPDSTDEEKAAPLLAAKTVRFDAFYAVVKFMGGSIFSRDDVTVTLLANPTRVGTHGLLFVVSAAKAGIPLDIDPLRAIHNPPNKVPTGTWHVETIDGEPVDVKNFREDPRAALESILLDSVIKHPR